MLNTYVVATFGYIYNTPEQTRKISHRQNGRVFRAHSYIFAIYKNKLSQKLFPAHEAFLKKPVFEGFRWIYVCR